MDNEKYSQYINETNGQLKTVARHNNQNRNYAHFFRPHVNKPLSIVGSFRDAIELEGDSVPNFCENSRMSFGMVAEASFTHFRWHVVGSDHYSDRKNFEEYVDQNCRMFCLDAEEYESKKDLYGKYTLEQYRKALFARAAIVSSWEFGFDISIEGLGDLQEPILNDSAVIVKENKDKTLYVRGRLSKSVIDSHADTLLTIRNADNRKETRQVKLRDLYSEDNINFFRSRSSALYSGVMPRLCKVEYEDPGLGNIDVHKFTLMLGRTSFMTINSLRYGRTESQRKILYSHPFMNIDCGGATYADINRFFDRTEVDVQTLFMSEMKDLGTGVNDITDELEILNRYLSRSWNIHNVNISGNVITGDDYCVYTKRSGNVSDPNILFCSVNGGSEIMDSAVSYYRNPVEEDIPTIAYSKDRFYFGGELTRESVAELGLTDNSPFWKYYGLSCMCGYDGPGTDFALWMHFNVLGEKNCSMSYDQIAAGRLTASEKYENQDLFGYRLTVLKSRKKTAAYAANWALSHILAWKDILILVITLLLLKTGMTVMGGPEKIVSLVFSFLASVALINHLIKTFIKSRHLSSTAIRTYIRKPYKNVFVRIFNVDITTNDEDNYLNKVDNILFLLTRMRIMDLINERE